MNTCLLGYFFARIKDTDKITIVSCWGDKIEKETKQDIEIIEKVPSIVISKCESGVKILNLKNLLNQKERG